MLATLTRDHFSDPGWVYEPKLDGIRCLAFKRGTDVRLMTRNKLDRAGSFPKVAEALSKQTGDFIVDGEVAALEGDRTSFSLLQQSQRSKVSINYFVFDILFVDGKDMTRKDLLTRKAVLKESLRWRKPLSFVSYIEEEGEAYLDEACKRGWEGLIAKRAAAPYTRGRSRDWLKFKCANEQELVIGGYTDPQGARSHFGALLVGYYEGGQLRYAGKVGTGYNQRSLEEIHTEMRALESETSPFAGEPPVRKNVHWLEPRLVAQVGFGEWTPDGRLRHPRFIGLRRDKKAKDVVREG